jgi:hypothetical protein
MEALIVLSIVVLAAVYFIRKMYKGLKKGGDYKCSACAFCTLCSSASTGVKKACCTGNDSLQSSLSMYFRQCERGGYTYHDK